MRFTEQQQQAIFTTGTNLMVTAGAGSGKTRVLVERFIALLEANSDWSLASIVAITFTEKAAREMRDRVRQAITERIRLGIEVTRWRQHEAALDSARIGTIHSLCAQILRANPVETRLDPGFRVIDEVEAALLRHEAVENALSHLTATGAEAAQLLLHYEVRIVRDLLYRLAGQAFVRQFDEALDGLETVEALLQYWQMLWEEDVRQMVTSVRDDYDLQGLLHWIDSEVQPTDDKLWAYWEMILEHRDSLLSDDPQVVVAALQSLKEIKVNVGSAKAWGGKDKLIECKEMLKEIRQRVDDYLTAMLPPLGELDHQAARLLFWWYQAVLATWQAYEDLKQEQNTLDFDDLEVLTVDLLTYHPTVAARYADGEFNHVMVDEFQDTNAMQLKIINALCGIDEAAPPGRLFVVGDPKQSIYAFRGADVSVFGSVRRDIVDKGGQLLSLSQSFRSHERLVSLYNHAFERILRRESGPVADFFVEYESMVAHREAIPHHEAPILLICLESKEINSSEKRQWEALELGNTVRQMIADGVPVWDKEARDYRPIAYGDIAILFQSMTHTPLYESVFQYLGIPYITVAGRGYFDRQEVWDVMNLLAALHNPADDLALAAVLRSPMFAVSDEGLLALRLGTEDTLWEAVMNAEIEVPEPDRVPLQFARRTLVELRMLAGRVPIAELLEHILETTAFEATLASLPNGMQRRANINKLLNVARRSQRVSLSEFNAYLRDMVGIEAREGEAALEASGVVTLMSVHKSKGLEFPVVVLADASWSRRPDDPALLLDPLVGAVCKVRSDESDKLDKPTAYQLALKYSGQRDQAERRRLLYVAATRAQDYLIVSGSAKSGTHWLSQMQQALGDLVEARVLEDPPDLRRLSGSEATSTLWDELVRQPQLSMEDTPLPLLHTVSVEDKVSHWHINATDLEKLNNRHTRRDLRRVLVGDMPSPIKPVVVSEPMRAYVVGEIVHRVLGVGLLPKATDDMLLAYAQELGVRQPDVVVSEALKLLQQYERSQAAELLVQADEVHREIPFVFQQGHIVVHGVIDVLFRLEGRWHVLDYKTGGGKVSLKERSRRYLHQMGAYASAIERQTGQTPLVWLHFLAPNQLYQVPESEWRPAIVALDQEISAVLHRR